MPLTIVSFFTPNWEYPEHAERLAQECMGLGLQYHIEEQPDTGSYLANSRWKPSVIRRTLEATKRPVLWLDVDSSIYAAPEAVDLSLDFMACPNPDVFRRWMTGALFFNWTRPGLALLDLWVEMLEDWSDHLAFENAWASGRWAGKWGELPATYNELIKGPDHQVDPATVIGWRLSDSEQKMAFKARDITRHPEGTGP